MSKAWDNSALLEQVKQMKPTGLVYLQWEHHQSNTDEDDHQQLGGPDLRRDVPIAHSGEGDDAEIEGVKQGELLPGSL